MALSHSRKRRAAETQRLVAAYLAQHGWPYATDAGAGRQGEDILGVAGLSIEVKARRDLNLPAWLRQAGRQAGIPIVVHRPDGFGPERIPPALGTSASKRSCRSRRSTRPGSTSTSFGSRSRRPPRSARS